MEFSTLEPSQFKFKLKRILPDESNDRFEKTAPIVQREYLIKWTRESTDQFIRKVAKALIPDNTESGVGFKSIRSAKAERGFVKANEITVTRQIREKLAQNPMATNEFKMPLTKREVLFATAILDAVTVDTTGYQGRNDRLDYLTALNEVRSAIIENGDSKLQKLGFKIGSTEKRVSAIENATIRQLGFSSLKELSVAPVMEPKEVFDRFVTGNTQARV